MTGVVNTKTAETVALTFVEHVRSIVHVKAAYLFGSWVQSRGQAYSDIDVAIVSSDFSGTTFQDALKLAPAVLATDPNIEVHTYRPEEFDADLDPLVAEILEHGVKLG